MKRVFAALLAFVMALSVLSCLSVSVSAESLYIRKIVSVVYDDSGSMNGDKATYANYAMQAFCGMLNSDDQLFITYMREPTQSVAIDLSAGGIQDSVDSIRDHSAGSGTPYTAVETAFSRLGSVQDANPNTQYWLVIITDGRFNDGGFEACTDNDEHRNLLNRYLEGYVGTVMPNGSAPQVTCLGIGSDAIPPDENQSKGIYTYTAADAPAIIDAMSSMADRISGRTRLQKSDIQKTGANTLQVSSAIPLLNIAVFVQETGAKVARTVYGNEIEVPVSRDVSLGWPNNNSGLNGSAFLLGDSQKVIGAGTYEITFDQDIDPENVVILFEPALEMRMIITVNGQEISSVRDLDNTMEGDKISVSCKIYEMGTDTEVDASLLPPGTEFELTVSENGTVVDKVSGQDMHLSDYVLKNVETEIVAAVTIEGFNPIDFSAKFTPAVYDPNAGNNGDDPENTEPPTTVPVETEPPINYTITAQFGSGGKSIKLDHIANNSALTVIFTVYADGVAITDSNTVKSLNPVISSSPQGNDGITTYSNDGKIIFTPKSAVTTAGVGYFDVTVTCTLANGVSASEVYTVLISDYAVIAMESNPEIKRTEMYGNQNAASFYVTKDGAKLGKSEVEGNISVALNEEYVCLKTNVTISDDGIISITPYSEEQRVLTFWNWWANWAYYFGLEKENIKITLNHPYGTATGTINVVGADTKYCILNVYLPLILEILILAAIIAYVIRYLTKPRFASNGVLYVGTIALNRSTAGTHRIELREIHLKQFNKFKNLWNPFKELSVFAGGISITAAKGNRIICNEPFPWYSDAIRPKARTMRITSPKEVVDYCREKDELVIHEIKTVRVMDEQNRVISQDDSVYYFARADITYVKVGNKQTEVIDSAVAFCYSTVQN